MGVAGDGGGAFVRIAVLPRGLGQKGKQTHRSSSLHGYANEAAFLAQTGQRPATPGKVGMQPMSAPLPDSTTELLLRISAGDAQRTNVLHSAQHDGVRSVTLREVARSPLLLKAMQIGSRCMARNRNHACRAIERLRARRIEKRAMPRLGNDQGVSKPSPNTSGAAFTVTATVGLEMT